MHLTGIRLQDYRNIPFAELLFEGSTQLFIGQNAQGKTNLLEAVGLLAALRSFRTQELSTLIRQGQPEGRLAFQLQHEISGSTEVMITLRRKGKTVTVDDEKVTRFRDFIGRFPVVVLCSQDIQLLRGSPSARRQWLNLFLSSASSSYYDSLRDYHKLLQERNSLLKRNGPNSELKVFEELLARHAVELHASRASHLGSIEAHVKAVYSHISPDEEFPELIYKPGAEVSSEDQFLELLDKNRERDQLLKSTQQGPHRDDIQLRLQSRRAREFASEGQQRSLIIALKIAQLQYLQEASGVVPLLLADDVLGELDEIRSSNFWQTVGESVQVMASGTELPSACARNALQVFQVSAGAFTPDC